MVQVTFVAADGVRATLDAAAGLSLMEAAKAGDIAGIEAVCGGNAYCGTCRVHVAPEWLARLAPQESFEHELLESLGEEDGSVRLSCQIPVSEVLDGLVATVPAAQI
jgi:2Fe-2S ferredoxin